MSITAPRCEKFKRENPLRFPRSVTAKNRVVQAHHPAKALGENSEGDGKTLQIKIISSTECSFWVPVVDNPGFVQLPAAKIHGMFSRAFWTREAPKPGSVKPYWGFPVSGPPLSLLYSLSFR